MMPRRTYPLLFTILLGSNIFAEKPSLSQSLHSEILEQVELLYRKPAVEAMSLKKIRVLKAKIAILEKYPDSDSTEYGIQISNLDFANLWPLESELYSGAQFGPVLENGKILGYQLKKVVPTNLFSILGFKEGDFLIAIDDTYLESAVDIEPIIKKINALKNSGETFRIKLQYGRNKRNKLKIIEVLPRPLP